MRMIPDSTMTFSNLRHHVEELRHDLLVGEAHHALHARPVVPAAVEDDDLARRREMGQVALDVHLRLLALGRRGQGDDAEVARAHALGDRLDRAALARGVAALEDDAHLQAGVDHPLLHLHQLDVQLLELLRVFLVAELAVVLARLPFALAGLAGILARLAGILRRLPLALRGCGGRLALPRLLVLPGHLLFSWCGSPEMPCPGRPIGLRLLPPQAYYAAQGDCC